MSTTRVDRVKRYVLQRLEKELSPRLVYHCLSHTTDEVVPAAERLATMEGIKGRDLQLLRTAAWLHDIGFVEGPSGHEAASARIAGDILPDFGYTQEEIEIVQSAILATALPQSPKTRLEEVLTDADLDVLGREELLRRNLDLREEWRLLGRESTDEQWYEAQLKFMRAHRYFTASARQLRDRQKLANIIMLKGMLEGIKTR